MAAKPLAEFHHPFVMTRWAKVSALARKGEKVLMAAVGALDPGKSVVKVTAMQVAVDDLPHVRPKKPYCFAKASK